MRLARLSLSPTEGVAFFSGSYSAPRPLVFFYASTKAKTFYVVMHTNSGEIRAISSKDYTFIQKIVDGINNAIIHRG